MPSNDLLAMMLKLTKVQKKLLNLEFIRIEIFCVSKYFVFQRKCSRMVKITGKNSKLFFIYQYIVYINIFINYMLYI